MSIYTRVQGVPKKVVHFENAVIREIGRNCYILDCFWNRESNFWAKTHIFDKNAYFRHKLALERGRKLKNFWGSSKHLSKSCKKIKSVPACGYEWQHHFFGDTLYYYKGSITI